LFVLNSTNSLNTISVNTVSSSGALSYLTSYQAGNNTVIIQANFAMEDTLYVKFTQAALNSQGQNITSVFFFFVDYLTPKISLLIPRGNATKLGVCNCSTNNSDVYQDSPNSIIAYSYPYRLYTKVILPANTGTIQAILCSSSDFAVLCINSLNQFYFAAIRISAHQEKSDDLVAYFPISATSCNGATLTDYHQRVYMNIGINSYMANGLNPKVKVYSGAFTGVNILHMGVTNWGSQLQVAYHVQPRSNSLSVTTMQVPYSSKTVDIESVLNGNIYQMNLVVGTYQVNSVALYPRAEEQGDILLTNPVTSFMFAMDTYTGSYCYQWSTQPGVTPVMITIGQLYNPSASYNLQFWSTNIASYGLFENQQGLSLLILYYNSTYSSNMLTLFQSVGQGYLQIYDLILNTTTVGLTGMYDFGGGVYFYVLQEVDPESFLIVVGGPSVSGNSWFMLREVSTLEWFTTSDKLFILILQARYSNSQSPMTLSYHSLSLNLPQGPATSGDIQLPFDPSLIRRMQCTSPDDSSSSISFICYFGLVNGSLARYSFSPSGQGNYTVVDSFVFSQLFNGWIDNIKIFDDYVSTFNFNGKNNSIVNYYLNESSQYIHSAIFTDTDVAVDYFITNGQLTYYSDDDPVSLGVYTLHDAYLSFPNQIDNVFSLSSVMMSFNDGEQQVKLVNMLHNDTQPPKVYFILFAVLFGIVIIVCGGGCFYLFRYKDQPQQTAEHEPDAEQKEREIKIKQERKLEIEKDLQKSFNRRGDDTIEEIENMV
jgi:hypothetical protein